MQLWKFLSGIILSTAFVLLALTGCALDSRSGGRDGSVVDIQERLSTVITRNGFAHGLRSERGGTRHVDSIYINVPLDSLKRRHYSLENLIKDIARVCTQPDFAAFPIRVEFGGGDEKDKTYMQEVFLREAGERKNIKVSITSEGYNDIEITIYHPR